MWFIGTWLAILQSPHLPVAQKPGFEMNFVRVVLHMPKKHLTNFECTFMLSYDSVKKGSIDGNLAKITREAKI